MKDIPVFTTENGIASLILKDIPYRQEAYIRIRSSLMPQALVEECAGFCRMCGAGRIYAADYDGEGRYALHTEVLLLRRDLAGMPQTDAALFPVQQATLSQWRQIYNRRMQDVPGAAWMTEKDAAEMLKAGDGYFVHRDGVLLGIGRASGDRIDAVAAVQKGAGADVVCALCHALTADTVSLEVASQNQQAMALYRRLGFVSAAQLCCWYLVSAEPFCTDESVDRKKLV